MKLRKTIAEIEKFLEDMKRICLIKENVTVNNLPWANGKINKTMRYMTETGIDLDDIIRVLHKLTVENYSYTEEDRNSSFENEYFWFFGITEEIVDQKEDLYVKLKVRECEEGMLLIMSFHPEQPLSSQDKLDFPYKETNN